MRQKLTSIVEFKEFLKNPSPKVKVPLYTEEEVEQNTNSGDDTVKKPTLSQRIDRLEESIATLATEMRAGFNELRQDVNSLKLDVNGLKQDVKDINARLDYNGLKQLPKDNK